MIANILETENLFFSELPFFNKSGSSQNSYNRYLKDGTVSEKKKAALLNSISGYEPTQYEKKNNFMFSEEMLVYYHKILPAYVSYQNILDEICNNRKGFEKIPEYYEDHRKKWVKYLEELVDDYDYKDKVFFLALKYLDAFVCIGYQNYSGFEEILYKETWSFIVVACFMIASKIFSFCS